MGSIDFDQVESNKFWKGIIADVLITAVIITLVICIYDYWQTAKMVASGYEIPTGACIRRDQGQIQLRMGKNWQPGKQRSHNYSRKDRR